MPPRKRSRVSGANGVDADEAEAAPINVDVHYNDEEADLTVISSDRVHFKVRSYHLRSASPVFRAMIESCTAGSKAEVQLHDDEIETARVLRILLDLACHKIITGDDFDAMDEGDFFRLIPLLDKYDCSTLRHTIVLLNMSPPKETSDLFNRFVYACALDDVDTAHRILPDAADVNWAARSTNPDSVSGCVDGGSVLDLTGMSTFWLDRLPRKYFLALLRATRLRILDNKASWQDVADEFRRHVKLQDPKPVVEATASS